MAALFATGTARADVTDTDRQVAQALFDEARALLDAGRAAEACPKLEESQRLDPGGGTLLNLALCLELSGKTGSAWARFQDARAAAVRDGRADREAFARTHLTALEPRLRRLVVFVPRDMLSLHPVVTLDGTRLPTSAFGTAIPVDPGSHVIGLRADGHEAWQATLSVPAEGETIRTTVELGAPLAPPPSPSATLFWAALGVGGAALVSGGVVGAMALSSSRDAEAGCAPARDFCTDDGRNAASRARTEAWISTGLVGLGVASVAVALIALRPTSSLTTATPSAKAHPRGLAFSF